MKLAVNSYRKKRSTDTWSALSRHYVTFFNYRKLIEPETHEGSICIYWSFLKTIYLFCWPMKKIIKTHEAFRKDRSSCVHRSLSTRVCAQFEFCVLSLFTVHISFIKFRSEFTHRSLCVRSAFAHRWSGIVDR